MKECPKCASTYGDAVKFCPRDGTALAQRIGPIPDPTAANAYRCPTCGAAYGTGRFCMVDGALLEAAS
jgi:hypothetical protein